MILRVLRAASEEFGASTITYHQESFRAILILFPPFRELARPVMGTNFLVESERTHCCTLIDIFVYIYTSKEKSI